MAAKPGYFDRTPTIHTHAQMMERLAQRTAKVQQGREGTNQTPPGLPGHGPEAGPDGAKPSSTPPPLSWSAKQRDPVGKFEFITCGPYRITRESGKFRLHHNHYYLGEFKTPDEAKRHAQTHYEAQ